MLRLILSDLALWARGLTRLRTLDYKPGWGPWTFLLPYLTTYLAGTLLGYGVVSLSRVWYCQQDVSRSARFMTRLLDRLFPGEHGVNTGFWLWGSTPRRIIA